MKMRVVKKTDDQICHVLEKSLHAHPFLNLRDKRGRTVLDCDKANGLEKTGKLLSKHGASAADVEVSDNSD
jgi:ankyrin repeat protein